MTPLIMLIEMDVVVSFVGFRFLLFCFGRQRHQTGTGAAPEAYRASHLAKEPLESFPQFPYGSPAELTLSKQIPGAGLAPAEQGVKPSEIESNTRKREVKREKKKKEKKERPDCIRVLNAMACHIPPVHRGALY